MQDNDTTSGSPQPDVVASQVRQAMKEAADQPITMRGCLHIVPVELPSVLGMMHPICSRVTKDGEHAIAGPDVFKDLDSNEVFCRLRCAAEEAVEKAIRIAKAEAIYPAVPHA